MKKMLLILFVSLTVSYQSFSCSCGRRTSFATTVVEDKSFKTVLEFKVLSKLPNSVKVEVVKKFKGDFAQGEVLTIWDYQRATISSCGHPGISTTSLVVDKRYVGMVYEKKAALYAFPYDTIGQLYIPTYSCGTSLLIIEGDSIKGATFGSYDLNPTSTNTFEYNMLYSQFLQRFTTVLGDEKEQDLPEQYLFPNPAKDYLTIKEIGGTLQIFNALNEMVMEKQNDGHLEISSLQVGVYFLHLQNGDRKKVFKFVKE